MHRDTDRFSRLASVSRALDFGPAARAHAFALLGPRKSAFSSSRQTGSSFSHSPEVAVQPVQDFLINFLRPRRQMATFEHRMSFVSCRCSQHTEHG